MAWDDDGSIAATRRAAEGTSGGTYPTQFSELAELDMQEANDEQTAGAFSLPTGSGGTSYSYLLMIFPELRELDGVYISVDGASAPSPSSSVLATSGDTTNGINGTWTTRDASYAIGNRDIDGWRTDIVTFAVSNIRAWRLYVQANDNQNTRLIQRVHVYGEIAAGETPDRLLWVDNDSGSEFSLPIDYGDIPRGSAEDREVVLRNNSSSLTAGSVQMTAEALYRSSDEWFTFAEAGIGTYQATLPLSGSISASSDSPVITVRRITPDDEDLGLHAARAYASASWS